MKNVLNDMYCLLNFSNCHFTYLNFVIVKGNVLFGILILWLKVVTMQNMNVSWVIFYLIKTFIFDTNIVISLLLLNLITQSRFIFQSISNINVIKLTKRAISWKSNCREWNRCVPIEDVRKRCHEKHCEASQYPNSK